jgi:hypothetical protein
MTEPTFGSSATGGSTTDQVRAKAQRGQARRRRPTWTPTPPRTAYARVHTRPRVRVYGCCLPITLGMLLAFLASVTLLTSLLLGAL